MAQDYAQGLSRSPRPNRIPRDGDRPNADMVERERAARERDSLEGRFGRFVDSGGNWATAWRAPAGGNSIGASPGFVAPARVVKFRTGELALQSAPADDPDTPTESTLIAPGQWVVRYDGDAESAIVVNDEAFRAEMRSEEQVRAAEAVVERPAEPASAPEAPARSSGAAAPQNAPAGTPGAPLVTTALMVDHFIKLVMADNNRLRYELSEAQRHRDEASMRAHSAEISLADMMENRDRWQREYTELRQLIHDKGLDLQPAVRESVSPPPEPVAVPPVAELDPVEATDPVELNPREAEVIAALHNAAADAAERANRRADPVEAALADAPPRFTGSKRKAI